MAQSKSKKWIAIGVQKGKYQTTSNIQSSSKKKQFTNKVQQRANLKNQYYSELFNNKFKQQSFYEDDELASPKEVHKSNKNLIKISQLSQKSELLKSSRSKNNQIFDQKNQQDEKQKDRNQQKKQSNDESEQDLSKSIVIQSIQICKQTQVKQQNLGDEYNQEGSLVLQSVSFSPQIQQIQSKYKSKTQFQKENQVYSYDKCPSIKISRPNCQNLKLKSIIELVQQLKQKNIDLKQVNQNFKIEFMNLCNSIQFQLTQNFLKEKQKTKNLFMLQKSEYQLRQAKNIELIMKKLQSTQAKVQILQKTLQKKEEQIILKQNILVSKLQLLSEMKQEISLLKQENEKEKQNKDNQTQKQALIKQRNMQGTLREKQIKYLQLNRNFDILRQENRFLELQKQNLQQKMFDLQQKIVGVEIEIQDKVRKQIQLIQQAHKNANNQNKQELNKNEKNKYEQSIQALTKQISVFSQKCKQYEENILKLEAKNKQKDRQNSYNQKTEEIKRKELQLNKKQNQAKVYQKKLFEFQQRLNSDQIKLQKEKLQLQKKQIDLTKIQNGLSKKAIQIKAKQQQLLEIQSTLQEQINNNQIKQRQLQEQQYQLSMKFQQMNNVRQSPRTVSYQQKNANFNVHIPKVQLHEQQDHLNYNPYVIPSSPYIEGYSNSHLRGEYQNSNTFFQNRENNRKISKYQNQFQKEKNLQLKNQHKRYQLTNENLQGYKLHYERNYNNQPTYYSNLSYTGSHLDSYAPNANKPKTNSMKIKEYNTNHLYRQNKSDIKLYQSSANQSPLHYKQHIQNKNLQNASNLWAKTKSPLKKLYQQSKLQKSKVQLMKKPKKFQSTRLYQLPSKDGTSQIYTNLNSKKTNSNINSIKQSPHKNEQKITTSKQIRKGVVDINLKLEQLKQQIRKEVNSLQ